MNQNNEPLPDDDLLRYFADLTASSEEVDQQFLEALRERSLQEFTNAQLTGTPPTVASAQVIEQRNSSMRSLLVLLSIAVIFCFGWMVTSPHSQAATLTLADVLEDLTNREAVELLVKKEGESATVLINQAGAIRWQSSSDRYQIARGAKLWEVTDAESESPAVSSAQTHSWLTEEGQLDLVALLGLKTTSGEQLLQATPDGIATYSGIDCLVFRELIKTPDGHVRLNFYAAQDSKSLIAVTARHKGAPRTGPPIAEIAFVARNKPLDDALFRIPVQLNDESKIGHVTDQQGLVSVRPLAATRWTPLVRETKLRPRDWIKTAPRGANAITINTNDGVRVILGPGTLIETVSANQLKLLSGTIEVRNPQRTKSDFDVLEKDAKQLAVPSGQTKIIRRDATEGLVSVAKKPNWLKQYQSATTDDSLGSLIVEIDGRATPLSVGEHHVTVEIRDQIARTTIEETFVNHTDQRMEGVFHFPLPQEASISGFVMWINGELIEADIVEKQRAREIFETILREKRDPGLLEWTGGNQFKARVFPIEPHSDKRIKIVYTQVLPLQGDRFRYRYALNSELLQTHPLRELNIRCLVNSTVPLSAVDSPTHDCRTQLSDHSAQLEFTAEEYTPTKDFEVVCDVSQRENDVVLIPHRRGDDGYFLLELMPPGEGTGWQRQVVGDGPPLDLILLCDTSRSMTKEIRKQQHQFVETLISSLDEQDRVGLAAVDSETKWLLPAASRPTAENLESVLNELQDRISLGWTDLQQGLTAAVDKASPETQIIYIGDGVPTSLNSQDQSLSGEVQRLLDQKFGKQAYRPAVHAVTIGSGYDAAILQSMSRIGHGSLRQILGDQTPQVAAHDLLMELTQPGLKEIQVNFEGFQVAAVYPDQLPNVPAGSQQILVGRYLPTGAAQQGKVIVTGHLNGEPVQYVAQVRLDEAEQGNSFIPRLWARGRLDELLRQGNSQKIHDEIIDLSEEFHIITPYTSLLVLESDADRKRFGVIRRFQMRDGEQFFATGRDNLNYELKQQQMQQAAAWRLHLQEQIRSRYAQPGRHEQFLQQVSSSGRQLDLARKSELRLGVQPTLFFDSEPTQHFFGDHVQYFGVDGEQQLNEFSFYVPLSGRSSGRRYRYDEWYAGAAPQSAEGLEAAGRYGRVFLHLDSSSSQRFDYDFEFEDRNHWGFNSVDKFSEDSFSNGKALGLSDREYGRPVLDFRRQSERGEFIDGLSSTDVLFENSSGSRPEFYAGTRIQFIDDWDRGRTARGVNVSDFETRLFKEVSLKRKSVSFAVSDLQRGASLQKSLPALNPIHTLFPPLPLPRTKQAKPEISVDWPPEVVEVAQSLLIQEDIKKIAGGVKITREAQAWSDDFDRLIPSSRRIELYSPQRWLTVDYGQGANAVVNWRDETQRGIYSESLSLGQSRKLAEEDSEELPLNLPVMTLRRLDQLYPSYRPQLKRLDAQLIQLTLNRADSQARYVFEIDTEKRVVLQRKTFIEDELTETVSYRDFAEIGNRWIATRIITEKADHPPGPYYVINQQIEELTPNQFKAAWGDEQNKKHKSFELKHPLPTLEQAQQSWIDQQATTSDHFILLLSEFSRQNWDETFEHLRELEKLNPDQQGLTWLRVAIEITARRHEEARQRVIAELSRWITDNGAGFPATQRGDLFLTTHLLSAIYPIISWRDYAPVLELVKPIYRKQHDEAVALLDWQQRWLQALAQLKRDEEQRVLEKQMAEENPGNVALQIAFANSLARSQQTGAARRFLLDQLSLQDHWNERELRQLREHYAEFLENQRDYDTLLEFLESWLEVETNEASVYGRYLSALVFHDRLNETEQRVNDWLALVQLPEPLSPAQVGRTRAAIRYALGQGHNLRRYRGMDHDWLPRLFETASQSLWRTDLHTLANEITGNSSFRQSDEGDRLRAVILHRLLDAKIPLDPATLSRDLNLLQQGRLLSETADGLAIRQVLLEEWEQISQRILKLIQETEDPQLQHQFRSTLLTLYASSLQDQHLPYLRALASSENSDYQQQYRNMLFTQLLKETWTADIENEAFAIWEKLYISDNELDVRIQLVPKFYQLVDALQKKRLKHELASWKSAAEFQELTRSERQQQERELSQTVQQEFIERLNKVAQTTGADHRQLLPWIKLEQLRRETRLGQNTNSVIKECWQLLGDRYQLHPESKTASDVIENMSQASLQQQALELLIHVAARDNSRSQLHQRLLDYVDSAIALLNDAADDQMTKGEQEEPSVDPALAWKQIKQQLLILFDQPAALKKQLRQWIAEPYPNADWQRTLALLTAEAGDLDKSVQMFEELKENRTLSAEDHELLAHWYLALDRRSDYEKNRIESLKLRGENWLSNGLNHRSRNARSQSGPTEVDETTRLLVTALMQKARRPHNYYNNLRQLYTATRDFRLLKPLPEAMLGGTQDQVYPALEQFQHTILSEIRDEATTDQLLAYLTELQAKLEAGQALRSGETNERAIALDQRALKMLEALVAANAAKVLNQPGPHIETAMNALQASYSFSWGPHEKPKYAEFLKRVIQISVVIPGDARKPLEDVVLHQLKTLRTKLAEDDSQRMSIALTEAYVLLSQLNRPQEALQLLDSELKRLAAQNAGTIPAAYHSAMFKYSSYLQSTGAYATAESFIIDQLERLDSEDHQESFIAHLDSLYLDAFRLGGKVSLGQGDVLFEYLFNRLLRQAQAATAKLRRQYVLQIANLFAVGTSNNRPESVKRIELLQVFCRKTFPELFKDDIEYQSSLVKQFSSLLRRRVSSLAALEFLLTQYESYPERTKFTSRHPWSQHAYQLAEYRQEASQDPRTDDQLLSKLERRLLKIVIEQLRLDLINQRAVNQSIYHADHAYYWILKVDDFIKVAEEVLVERKDSPRTLIYVANYLYHGLDGHDRALQVLLDANNRGLLDSANQLQLVHWLHEQRRYGDSISLLADLIEEQPTNMSLRVLQMAALYQTEQLQRLRQLTEQTANDFQEKQIWSEGTIAQLARGCASTQQSALAAKYFEEAISRHQSMNPQQRGNQTLSRYYRELSVAYQQLHQTSQAVDAAAGAIVCWGPQQVQRRNALDQLNSILMTAPDLDQFLAETNKKAKQSGQESPLIRKAIARRFMEEKQYQDVVEQLQKALEVSPYDPEIYEQLIEAYDQLGHPQQAIESLLKWTEFERHRIDLAVDLAKRTRSNPQLAERAETTIIEISPTEAEPHQALATFLEKQNRWEEALPHWKKVAEYRRLEPTGLLGLTKAYMKTKQWQAAENSLSQLKATEWPDHFTNLQSQIEELEAQLETEAKLLNR